MFTIFWALRFAEFMKKLLQSSLLGLRPGVGSAPSSGGIWGNVNHPSPKDQDYYLFIVLFLHLGLQKFSVAFVVIILLISENTSYTNIDRFSYSLGATT